MTVEEALTKMSAAHGNCRMVAGSLLLAAAGESVDYRDIEATIAEVQGILAEVASFVRDQ